MPRLLYLIAFVLLIVGGFAVVPVLGSLAGEPRFAGQVGTLALILLVTALATAALLAGLASIGNRVDAQTKRLDAILQELRRQGPGETESAAEAEPEPPPKALRDMSYAELVEHVKRKTLEPFSE